MAPSQKILIIDDEKMTAKLMQSRFQKFGFNVEVLTDEEDWQGYVNNSLPDLVLLDLVMPTISGLDVLRTIRGHKKKTELPIIMLTASEDKDTIVQALKSGANDYLLKATHIDVALARVTTQLDMIKLYKESLSAKELETLNAMIVTYNHEINNPLTIALGALSLVGREVSHPLMAKIASSLRRIGEITSKIKALTDQKDGLEKEDYADGRSQMIKIR